MRGDFECGPVSRIALALALSAIVVATCQASSPGDADDRTRRAFAPTVSDLHQSGVNVLIPGELDERRLGHVIVQVIEADPSGCAIELESPKLLWPQFLPCRPYRRFARAIPYAAIGNRFALPGGRIVCLTQGTCHASCKNSSVAFVDHGFFDMRSPKKRHTRAPSLDGEHRPGRRTRSLANGFAFTRPVTDSSVAPRSQSDR